MQIKKIMAKYKQIISIISIGLLYPLYFGIYYFCCKNFFNGIGGSTFSWTTDHALLVCLIISLIPAFFGAYKFSFITFAGYVSGVILGDLFGGFKVNVPPMYSHYGWTIWLIVYVLAIITGIIIECIYKRRL